MDELSNGKDTMTVFCKKENVMKKLGFCYEKDISYECNNGKVKREGVQCRWSE